MIHSFFGGEVYDFAGLGVVVQNSTAGKYPLGFFFLDEEKLDKVMNALAKLHVRKGKC